MSDIQLLNLLTALNYSPDEVREIKAAAERVEAQRLARINAMADTNGLLTVTASAAQSPRHAAALRRLNGELKHATKYGFHLPENGFVSLFELEKAFSAAGTSTEKRMDLKAQLHALNLIPA